MPLEPKWKCGECNGVHDDEEDALDCCDAEFLAANNLKTMQTETIQNKARRFLKAQANGDSRCTDLLLQISIHTGLSIGACVANIMMLAAKEE